MCHRFFETDFILPSISRSGNEKLGPSKPKLPRKKNPIFMIYICSSDISSVVSKYYMYNRYHLRIFHQLPHQMVASLSEK